MPKVDKKIIIAVAALAVLIFAAVFGLTLFQKKEEVLIPEEPVQEEEKTLEKILQELTPSEYKPLTPQEQEEIDRILKEMTPSEPDPIGGKDRKELEELLNQLTPNN